MIDRTFVRDREFVIDGVGLRDVLKSRATPFYLYSADVIRKNYRKLKDRFAAYEIFYSFKANPNLTISRLLLSMGANADVSSLGEIEAAMRAGFKPKNMVLVGPGKSAGEVRAALSKGVYAVAAESAYELDMIDSIAGDLRTTARILLRINTLEETISQEMMVGGPSKFGFDEECVIDDVRDLRLKHSRIAGVHVYSASQVLDDGFLSRHLEYVMNLALSLSDNLGFGLECIDFGGGFGIPYTEDEAELDLESISRVATRVSGTIADRRPGCRLIFEVGRFVVAQAGIYVTRVIRIKRSRGRCFIITDGGMNGFTRPVFMRLNHPVRILNRIGASRDTMCSIGGPVCTPLDITARDVMLPAPEPGDILGVFNAGAYGFTMSLVNFMSLGQPAELMADSGKLILIRKARPASSLFDDQVITDVT